MYIKDNLMEIKTTITNHFPDPKFLVMFIGVVIAPFVLFVVGGRLPHTFGQTGFAWSLMVIALLLFVSISGGVWLFRRAPNPAHNISIKQR